MPNQRMRVISPTELQGSNNTGLFNTAPYQRKYLAQGDSWFSIGGLPPWATTQLLMQMTLSRTTLAVNCARPGAQLAHMTDTCTNQGFLNLLVGNIAWNWDGLLISGGGNDLIDAANADPQAPRAQRIFLRADEWATTGDATRYLSPEGWQTLEQHLSFVLQQLLVQRDRRPRNRGIPVVLHTYDYVTPRNAPAGLGAGPWLYKALQSYGIPAQDWITVADLLINQLAEFWLGLENSLVDRRVLVVDSRGATQRAAPHTTGSSNDWENEIHPTPHGYAELTQRWRAVLDALP